MLHLKNNILTSDAFTIDSHSTILQLSTDILDCDYFGIIKFPNKIVKSIQFVKFDKVFKARVTFSEEELPYLLGATLKILSVSATFSKKSNEIPFNVNLEKLKLTIKQSASKDLAEFKTQFVQLKQQLEALSLGKLVPNINIANKDFIQPGMVLVAIDNGNFMAAYPFADVITEVNGQQAVDGVVEIDASMIKYNTERTIKEQMTVIGEAIKTQNQTLLTISSQLNALSKNLADLTVKVETHLDNGII